MGPVAIRDAYSEAFACDYMVDTRGGAAEPPTFNSFTFQQLHHDSGVEGIESGMPAIAVYRQLWTEEFRWEGTRRPPVVIPTSEDPQLAPFIDACFGNFANSGDLSSFRDVYESLLGAVSLSIDVDNFLDGFRLVTDKPFLTPLGLGMHGLSVRPADRQVRAEVLLVDSRAPSDLLDLWNLRATGRTVIPIPLCWSKDLLPELGRRLAALPDLKDQWDTQVLVTRGRRVGDDEVAAAAEQLAAAGVDAFRSGPPAPGRELKAAWVSAQEDEVELRGDVIGSTFPLSEPKVAEHYEPGVLRWMNVINYVPWTLPHDGSVGAFLPPELGEVADLLRSTSHLSVRASLEGILVPSGSPRDIFRFTPPSGERILSQLLTGSPVEAKPTEPGRTATQLIRQMKGLHAVALVQRQPLVTLFNKAAHGAAVLEAQRARPPRPATRFLPLPTLEEAVREIHPESTRGRDNLMRGLVDRDVLRAGVQLRCVQCDYVNWVQLDDVSRTVTCERCLEEFAFPQDDPPHRSSWAYRPTGAFSVPDFANGGYSVAFALRFLGEEGVGQSRSSWCTGFQLDRSNEIDFAAVIADERDIKPHISLVLGEAKSFGRFMPRDFERGTALLRRYPSATLAFATLRETITDEEKRSIAGLARPKVERHQDLPFEPRVLLLTATELFSRDGPPECWEDAGGEGEALAKNRAGFGRPAISAWADVTLQLHAGLGPHTEWWESERPRF
jgi:hypothetical protein